MTKVLDCALKVNKFELVRLLPFGRHESPYSPSYLVSLLFFYKDRFGIK